MEELDPTNICIYWPNSPALDPKRLLLCRLFFINEERTKYVSVAFYFPATIYCWWDLVSFREAVDPKPSSSAMNRWTLLHVFPCYGTKSGVARRLLWSRVQER